MVKDIVKKIKKVRKRLNISIEKNGIESEETKEISNQINELINEYYNTIRPKEYPENSDIKPNYEKSYIELKQKTDEMKRFPTVQEWNKYAKEKGCLSNVSMEYISELKWNYLRAKIMSELNMGI